MHVLMISMDTFLLTQQIGAARTRHEAYAEQAGRLSIVVCNRRMNGIMGFDSPRLHAYPTQSRSYLHYLIDGYRMGLRFHLEQPVDLVTTQDPFLTALIGLALRSRLKAPLIIQDHSSLLENRYFAEESRRNRLLQLLARQTIRYADAVRVVNAREQAACLRRGSHNVCSIPVPEDYTSFTQPVNGAQKAEWYARLNLEVGTPVVIWVGRNVPVKNLPLLLDAFARVHSELPDVHFILAGDRRDLPEQVQARGLSAVVHLTGPVPHDDLRVLYQIARIYAHSSNYEGFGLTLVEAAASGLPVVSTATDGAREVIDEGQTGLLVPVGDCAALSATLMVLLRDPERAATMGLRAREHVRRHFNEQALMAQWIGMWRSVAARQALPCAA